MFFYFIKKTKWIELQKIKNPKQNKKKAREHNISL